MYARGLAFILSSILIVTRLTRRLMEKWKETRGARLSPKSYSMPGNGNVYERSRWLPRLMFHRHKFPWIWQEAAYDIIRTRNIVAFQCPRLIIFFGLRYLRTAPRNFSSEAMRQGKNNDTLASVKRTPCDLITRYTTERFERKE